jgi:hypothetical protein
VTNRLQPIIAWIGYFVIWLSSIIFVTLTAFQVHGTLIAISLAVIENPNLRPPGWSTNTTYGLSRVFWLILGILWLGWVMYTEGYLREGYQRHLLIQRSVRLGIILAVVYGSSLIILFLLQ